LRFKVAERGVRQLQRGQNMQLMHLILRCGVRVLEKPLRAEAGVVNEQRKIRRRRDARRYFDAIAFAGEVGNFDFREGIFSRVSRAAARFCEILR
jgi:hypothetical protein